MLKIRLDARRGGFHLQFECALDSAWTVIFGPSGAGKSTLLRLIAGLERPQRGRIEFNDQVLTDTAKGVHREPGQRMVGMIAQQPALFPHLNVAANVAYGLAALDRGNRAERVEEMLGLVDGADLADRMPRGLSGGEAQRIALARALAPMPRLMLLDEPFSALDGSASDALLARLRRWVSENQVQCVMATHDATDAMAIGAEVALLREGRLAAVGPAAEVLAGERERMLMRLAL